MTFYKVARGLFRGLLRLKGYKIEGFENFPQQGPVIIACNHVSLWDPIVVGCALDRQIFFMAKEELFSNSVFGKVLIKLGAFPVKRGRGDISAIRKSLAVLKEGHVLGLFPEGTRSLTGEIQEALSGIVLIMEKTKAPIVPVKVYNTKNLITQKQGKIRVKVGEAVTPGSIEVPQGIDNSRIWIANQIMLRIDKM